MFVLLLLATFIKAQWCIPNFDSKLAHTGTHAPDQDAGASIKKMTRTHARNT